MIGKPFVIRFFDMRFDELNLSDDLLDALDAMQFEECTPIQERAIDVILDGNDLIAVAQTGTGKTAAYLLPVIDMLSSREHVAKGVRCVIMVPTHELAQQIDRQLEGFSYYLPVSGLAIHGGSDGKEFARQQQAFKMGADVVIATPGRLLAHMKMGYVDLSNVEFFVLDEADRMLDMGFYDDIMQIVKQLPSERQTLMFSATMPKKIQQLASNILHNPAEVKIAVSKPTEKIDQSAYVCHEPQKEGLLKYLFDSGYSRRVIVFASSKLKVKDLTNTLRRARWKAAEMHSDLDQAAREEAINGFRSGRIDILIATDIIARGIDIDDISMVVNFDVPREAEDYVHRIGRTARANADGKAVTFVSGRDQAKFKYIEDFLGYEVRKEQVPAELGEAPEYNPGKSGRKDGRKRSSVRDMRKHGNRDRSRNKPAASRANPENHPVTSDEVNGGVKSKRRRFYGKRRKGASSNNGTPKSNDTDKQ